MNRAAFIDANVPIHASAGGVLIQNLIQNLAFVF